MPTPGYIRGGKPRSMHSRSSFANRTLLGVLGSSARQIVDRRLCALRYTASNTTAAEIVLPVQYARADGGVVVIAAKPELKTWWRHFKTPAAAELWLDGRWISGVGRIVVGAEREVALAQYRAVFPHLTVLRDTPVIAVDIDDSARIPAAESHALVRLWIPVVTIAEFVGFAVPACVGVITASSSTAVVLLALLLAGAVEGAVLGWGQATVLQHALPHLSRQRWMVATASAAAFAYLIGLAPSTWASGITNWPPAATIAVMTTLGLLLLGSIGTAQWLVLRIHVTHGIRWILITSVAWLVGLATFLGFTMPLWHEGQGKGWTILIGIIGGFLMAATTSAVTGLGLRHILPTSGPSR